METFSKGVHRALVPLESSADNVVAVELVESAPGYKMLTQMDVIRFLRAHSAELKGILSRTVRELGAVNEAVFAVASRTKVIEAIKTMRAVSFTAVPVVDAPVDAQILRDCPVAQLQSSLGISVTKFKKVVAEYRASNPVDTSSRVAGGAAATDTDADTASATDKENKEDSHHQQQQQMVTCSTESTLGDVIEKAAASHVHRLWVADEQGLLLGVVSLTDILRVVREAALGEDRELHDIVSS